MDELGLALVDEVGMSLRQLVREARRRVDESGKGSVIRASIQTFLEFVERNQNLFRLLLGEGSGSTPHFRLAIAKEIQRFTDDLAEDLLREAKATERPIAHVHHAAEAMVIGRVQSRRQLDRPASRRAARRQSSASSSRCG